MRRVIEITLWGGGVFTLACYLAFSAWSAYASEAGIRTLQSLQAQTTGSTSAANVGGVQAGLTAAEPDTSGWSAKRLSEYLQKRVHGAPPEAVLRIPELNLEVPVYEGTSKATLARGAGRIEGTARIDGERGNVGIAAHRDGFFRELKHIKVGDLMLLDTLQETRSYRVASVHIVAPTEVSVLDPSLDARITLVTCYPFYYVGAAPQRFIVKAVLARGAASGERILVRDVSRAPTGGELP